jgi:alkanesulfonate monooxygenase SsuD/methylene tetrahydromethanopterin reductase-like flavin-dependent oxidoreductase (luciferase family)
VKAGRPHTHRHGACSACGQTRREVHHRSILVSFLSFDNQSANHGRRLACAWRHSASGRGAQADEFIAVLKAIWTSDLVEFQGQFYQIPQPIIQPKSVQKPYPPPYLAAFAPPALRRLAKWADEWNPAGIPIDGMR